MDGRVRAESGDGEGRLRGARPQARRARAERRNAERPERQGPGSVAEMKITRRKLAGRAVISVAAIARAQAPAETDEELLKAAREQVRRNSETLAKYQVPMSTE